MGKRILLLILLALSFNTLFAKTIEDRYITRLLEGGLLYFIKPFEVTNQQKGVPIELDITYFTQNDSCTVNMSLYYKELLKMDSLQIVSDQGCLSTTLETFYIDTEKKNFKHRYSCKIPLAYLESLYKSESPFVLKFYTDDALIKYAYQPDKWPKERSWMRQILYIIQKNRISRAS